MSIFHRFITGLVVLVVFSSMSYAEKFKAKVWGKIGIGTLNIGYPYLGVEVVGLAMGSTYPPGLGIGTKGVEAFLPYNEEQMGVGGYFPIYLYFIPYMRVHETTGYPRFSGWPKWHAYPIIYSFIGGSYWAEEAHEDSDEKIGYLRTGIGISWGGNIPMAGPYTIGLEAGFLYMHEKETVPEREKPLPFYVGVTLGAYTSWFGLGIEK